MSSAPHTGELAVAHDLSAPEVSRDLTVLFTRRRGRYVLHQLDVTVVARLGGEFLGGHPALKCSPG